MDTSFYLSEFEKAAGRLDAGLLAQKGLEVEVGIWLASVVLRQLRGYKITARDFAADFRGGFKPFARHWPNVSVDFGPLTLMEGWVALDAPAVADPAASAVAANVSALATGFLELASLIDALLERRKK
jgi:hypothetical protein